MTCESPLQPKLKSAVTGQKSIKKCQLCKCWDSTDNLYYCTRNAFYEHKNCRKVTSRNNYKTKKHLDPTAPKRFYHDKLGKCHRCKSYDSKETFDYRNRGHQECERKQSRNSAKMKRHKTDTCAFTGLPFGSKSEMKPVGDHDHDTLLYRGHIWSAANRLEGAAKFIMDEAGWTVDELCDALKSYLAKPGMDIGLEPYPQLGFATPEEAQQHYGC